MLAAEILQSCERLLQSSVLKVQPVGGGDINEARLLTTSRGTYFLKFNTAPQAGDMFEAEVQGLAALDAAQAIRIPRVLGRGTTENGQYAFLLLEFISTVPADNRFWRSFGEKLAHLHQNSRPQFGFEHSNFIGSLVQDNGHCDRWTEFYTRYRLEPQVKLALDRQYLSRDSLPLFDKLYNRLDDICPTEPPALIHGDLWSGNFLAGSGGIPVLIDPAAAYAHREMDLAMSQLFGGFSPVFYDAYQSSYPTAPGLEERIDIYQLYYLLVHLNLFGTSYAASVKRILRKWI